jgi:hypothetical protein
MNCRQIAVKCRLIPSQIPVPDIPLPLSLATIVLGSVHLIPFSSIDVSHLNERTTCAYGKSMESISAFSSITSASASASACSSLCLFANSRLIQMSHTLPLCTPSSPKRRLDSVRSGNPLAFVHKNCVIPPCRATTFF